MKFSCFLLLLSIFINSCTKSKQPPPAPIVTPNPINLPPKEFKVTIDSIFSNKAVISWTKSVDPEGDTIKYDVWLNNKVIFSELAELRCVLPDLTELTSYSGKIVAKDKKNETTAEFSFVSEKYFLKFLKLYEYDKFVSALEPGGGEVKEIIKTRDGNYILVGASHITGSYANGSQIFVLKTDYNGKEIWKKYYPFPVGSAFDVDVTESKNGLLIVSNINVLNIDIEGNLLWHKKMTSYDDGDGGTELKSVKEDLQGNFIIVGGRSAPEPEILQEGVVTKLDPSGNMLWEKAFKPTIRSYFYDVQISAQNELIVFGTREPNGITYQQWLYSPSMEQADFWLLKLNSNGEQIWEKIYGDSKFDIPAKLIIKSNGNYVFTGSTWGTSSDRQARLFEISKEGNVVWSLSYGVPLSVSLSLAETKDGGVITTGFAESGCCGKALQVNKFNSTGVEEWSQLYSEIGTFLFGRCILPESDGGYRIAVSRAQYVGYGNPAYIAVYKTDPLGRYK